MTSPIYVQSYSNQIEDLTIRHESILMEYNLLKNILNSTLEDNKNLRIQLNSILKKVKDLEEIIFLMKGDLNSCCSKYTSIIDKEKKIQKMT